MYETELSILKGLYRKGTFDSPFYRKFVNDENCFNDYDSFRKIIIVGDDIKRKTDEQGIVTMSLYDFFLDSHSIDRL